MTLLYNCLKTLFPILLHKLLHFRHSALIDEISVVRLALGGFVVDAGEHQLYV